MLIHKNGHLFIVKVNWDNTKIQIKSSARHKIANWFINPAKTVEINLLNARDYNGLKKYKED